MTGAPTRTLADLRISPIGLGGNVFGWTADEATSLPTWTAAGTSSTLLMDTPTGLRGTQEGSRRP